MLMAFSSLFPSLSLPPSPFLHHSSSTLQASDNHIGYMEKDPVRCNDSLESFEEVLRVAKEQEVTQHPGHGFMIATSMLANSSIERRSPAEEAGYRGYPSIKSRGIKVTQLLLFFPPPFSKTRFLNGWG